MKTTIKSLLLFIAILSLTQCGKMSDSRLYKNFVQSYSTPVSFTLEKGRYYVGQQYLEEGIIVRQQTGVILRPGDVHYDKLAQNNKDTRFNRRLEIGSAFSICAHNVSINPIESIDLISDADYDATHPAGTSLNDIFDIIFVDVIPIINEGYKGKKTTRMTLNEFNQSPRKFIELKFLLLPTRYPSSNSTHRLSMTYKQILGETIITTSEPITIKGAN